jgi:hypothetical protein
MALRMEAGITSLPPSMILTACANATSEPSRTDLHINTYFYKWYQGVDVINCLSIAAGAAGAPNLARSSMRQRVVGRSRPRMIERRS